MTHVKVFLCGSSSSCISYVNCEVTYELRKDCFRDDLFSKSEVGSTLGILDPGFWDFCSRYFCLAFIKEMYHSAAIFSLEMVTQQDGFLVWFISDCGGIPQSSCINLTFASHVRRIYACHV